MFIATGTKIQGKCRQILNLSKDPLFSCAFCKASMFPVLGIKHISKVSKCLGCRKVAYCNKQCQKKDWAQHKAKCNPLIILDDCSTDRNCMTDESINHMLKGRHAPSTVAMHLQKPCETTGEPSPALHEYNILRETLEKKGNTLIPTSRGDIVFSTF